MGAPVDLELDRRRRHRSAAADGWRPRETCGCQRPDRVALAGGNGYHLANMCGRCRRRLGRPGIVRP
ncbi:MAG TPA: hypothetical protein VKB54_06960 [Solirubrobacteraceae bacterium]|nr:hypothetical protein [Solirubrobacteraceae bacterium]